MAMFVGRLGLCALLDVLLFFIVRYAVYTYLRQAKGLDSKLLAVVLDFSTRPAKPSQHFVVDVLEVEDGQPVLGQLALQNSSNDVRNRNNSREVKNKSGAQTQKRHTQR